MKEMIIKRSDLSSLKKAYQQARQKNVSEFTWNERAILTDYAKYVIEFLELSGTRGDNKEVVVPE